MSDKIEAVQENSISFTMCWLYLWKEFFLTVIRLNSVEVELVVDLEVGDVAVELQIGQLTQRCISLHTKIIHAL